MPKSNPGVAKATSDRLPPGEAAAKLSPELFDERGRTVPWMAKTVRRLYDAQGQKILDRENLAIAYWYYLRVLAERGELNQLELSKRVGIASTTAVPALDNLEKRGLVQRIRDPKDRRKYYVSLKDEGRRLVDDMLPQLSEMFSASLDGISPRDMQVFWKVAHQIEKNLIRMSQDDTTLD
ncbi:MarR family winged helix-turn-helix transcriptional regulator [Paraburkholderia terrae]|uniref:MarR family transcriptional regulator n=1 Tax=Paraburkholderia terrae TaxID=311230 RepID=A0A2I8EU71_9BURK|nr:MarR family transcriptional regulator [Paraburkholderia terrae]AUT63165.1 MarR family transcriptional regulator [Paraburkholderia terrae]MDW3663621.1 MarR family transcriptional regulator [Paraburkholderia terrae]